MGTVIDIHVRPMWVRDAIFELQDQAEGLALQRTRLTEIAYVMKAGGANTIELADAAHDLEHAERHLTAARRALEMTWPDGNEKP